MLYSILAKDLGYALCLWQPLPTGSDLRDFAAFLLFFLAASVAQCSNRSVRQHH